MFFAVSAKLTTTKCKFIVTLLVVSAMILVLFGKHYLFEESINQLEEMQYDDNNVANSGTSNALFGTASYYEGGNGCGYKHRYTQTSSRFPYNFTAAVDPSVFDDGLGCGGCYEVTCVGTSNALRGGSNNNNNKKHHHHNHNNDRINTCICDPSTPSVIVQVTDVCDDEFHTMSSTHVHLNPAAMDRIVQDLNIPDIFHDDNDSNDSTNEDSSIFAASSSTGTCGVIQTMIKRVNCEYASNIKIRFKNLSNSWYGIHVENVAGYGTIQSVELKNSGDGEIFDIACTRSKGTSFFVCTKRWFTFPLSVQLTNTNGNVLTATDILTDYPTSDNEDSEIEYDFGTNFFPEMINSNEESQENAYKKGTAGIEQDLSTIETGIAQEMSTIETEIKENATDDSDYTVGIYSNDSNFTATFAPILSFAKEEEAEEERTVNITTVIVDSSNNANALNSKVATATPTTSYEKEIEEVAAEIKVNEDEENNKTLSTMTDNITTSNGGNMGNITADEDSSIKNDNITASPADVAVVCGAEKHTCIDAHSCCPSLVCLDTGIVKMCVNQSNIETTTDFSPIADITAVACGTNNAECTNKEHFCCPGHACAGVPNFKMCMPLVTKEAEKNSTDVILESNDKNTLNSNDNSSIAATATPTDVACGADKAKCIDARSCCPNFDCVDTGVVGKICISQSHIETTTDFSPIADTAAVTCGVDNVECTHNEDFCCPGHECDGADYYKLCVLIDIDEAKTETEKEIVQIKNSIPPKEENGSAGNITSAVVVATSSPSLLPSSSPSLLPSSSPSLLASSSPSSLPSSSPSQEPSSNTVVMPELEVDKYVSLIGEEPYGCYGDSEKRDLGRLFFNKQMTSPKACFERVFEEGYRFAGLQAGGMCFGGDYVGTYGEKPNDCNKVCSEDYSRICGGLYRNSVYMMPAEIVEEKTVPPSLVEEETAPASTVEEKTVPPSTVEEITVPPSTVEEITVPPSTVEEKTVPPSTAAEKTVPPSTVEEKTVPPSTAEEKTVPPSTVEEKTVPPSTVEEKTVPPSTVEEKTVPASTVEEKTAPASTVEEKKETTVAVATNNSNNDDSSSLSLPVSTAAVVCGVDMDMCTDDINSCCPSYECVGEDEYYRSCEIKEAATCYKRWADCTQSINSCCEGLECKGNVNYKECEKSAVLS